MPDISVNIEQQRAIDHESGPAIVLAGPGSGKTFVLTNRIIQLINKTHIDPREILTITFTRAAALEMRKRTIALNQKGEQVIFGTFHSIFYNILKTSETYFDFSIIKESKKKQILKEILYTQEFAEEEIPYFINHILKEISSIKSNGWDIGGFTSKVCPKNQFEYIFREYEKLLFKRKYIDFDDMVLLCFQYLKTNKEAAGFWQNRFSYVLIDEFQDINMLQYQTVILLTKTHKNLFVVGDDDQAIYGFRGSNPAYMKAFLKEFPNAATIVLDVNYRSVAPIVELAGKSVSYNKFRFHKNISAVRIPKETEGVVLKQFKEIGDETNFVVDRIKDEMKNKEMKNKEIQGKCAILFRTNGKAQFFAEKLFAAKIPYIFHEKQTNFYEHFLVQDILCYLKFAHLAPKRSYFYRFMNRPLRYIKRDAVHSETVNFQALYVFYFNKSKICSSIRKLEKDIQLLKTLDPFAAISYIMKGIGYERYGKELAEGNLEKRREYEEIMQELLERAKEFQSCKDFLAFISEYSDNFETLSNNYKPSSDHSEHLNPVRIMTYHASKGLEFETVYLPCINGGVVPYHKAVSKEEIEEERRMFYVAITRAKNKLIITSTKNNSGKQSEFWKEITGKA